MLPLHKEINCILWQNGYSCSYFTAKMAEQKKGQITRKIGITDNAACRSVYDPATKIVYSTYLAQDNSGQARDDFYRHIENLVHFAGQYPVRGILADLRQFSGQVLHALEYLEKEVIPVMKARGLTCEAFLSSHDSRLRQLCLQLTAMQNRQGVEAKLFYLHADAAAWVAATVNNHYSPVVGAEPAGEGGSGQKL